jgi:hypothetical protein
MNHLKYILTLAILVIGLNLFAQTDTVQYGKLEVKVIDAKTKKPIEYAVVTIENDSFKKSHYTDSNGLFVLDNVPFGIYNIYSSFTGYPKMKLQSIGLNKDSITYLKFEMIYSGKNSCMHCDLKLPLKVFIKPDEPTQQNFNNNQIMRMPY